MSLKDKKESFFGKLSKKIGDILFLRPEPDEETIDELEDVLVSSDLGVQTTVDITDNLRDSIREHRLLTHQAVKDEIRDMVYEKLDKGERLKLCDETPLIILMIGVNGAGKTTTIAKLGHMLMKQGKSVLLVAADTFRAAAAEQLTIWAERIGAPIIKHQEGADPSAVIFDGIQAAKARNIDVVICDTAGRLQNKKNLMDELAKMNRVIDREYPEAARETLLIVDATTGKNAVSQAKEFSQAAQLSGIILTKLDGTAKGGIVVTIADELDLPVKFIGLGEGMDDLEPFDPEAFADSIFGQ
ncbi:MAG: signal recognition particle-docking protein FtsY [Firmicutes bacterium]|jgi:fused signal recognition particle receptor|nr:signal recognition particle-docking protein FtsY [Bacillota bacterium]